MSKNINIIPLTADQFDSLHLKPDWKMVEVPQEDWSKIPNLPRQDDTITIYASGCTETPQTFQDIEHVGACDIIAHEVNPQIEKGEGNLNIYHCLFQKLKTPTHGYEYLMHYPFRSGSVVRHWAKDLEELQPYFDATRQNLDH